MGMGLMSDFLKGQYKSEQRGLYCPFVFYLTGGPPIISPNLTTE